MDLVYVAYKTSLYSPNGESLASWKTTGTGASRGRGVSWTRAREAMEKALRDAAKNFQTDFRKHLAAFAPELLL